MTCATTNKGNTPQLEPTQADRDAAAAYMDRVKSTRWSIDGILSGGCDNTSIVQAFARHAENTRQSNRSADVVEARREALENFCLAAEYWAGCDEGCDADTASSEIMRSGGCWPAEAYDRARTALTTTGDGQHG